MAGIRLGPLYGACSASPRTAPSPSRLVSRLFARRASSGPVTTNRPIRRVLLAETAAGLKDDIFLAPAIPECPLALEQTRRLCPTP